MGIVDGVDETGSFVPAIDVSEIDFVLSPPGVPIGQEFIVPAANHMVGVTDAAGVVWITTVNTDNLPFGAAVGASSGESAINPGGTFVQSHGAESGFNIVDGSAITLVAGSPFAISTAAIFYPSSFEEPSRTQYTMRTSVVPLPGTAALLLGGLGLLGFHGRRRQGGPSSAILTACSRSQSVEQLRDVVSAQRLADRPVLDPRD